MSYRSRLLFLSQTLPYPPDGGVKIRTYHILRQLSRAFDVTALCFYRWKRGAHEPDVSSAIRALSEFGRVEAFPIPQEHSRMRWVWDHAQSAISGRTYTVYTYRSAAFRQRLTAILAKERLDLAHADSLDLSEYFPLLRDLPLACVHHDAQSVLLRRRAEHERTPLRRAYVGHQAALMEREERRWCPAVTLNVVVSEVDRYALESRALGARFTIVPNGVDTEFFQPVGVARPRGLVFVGGSSWFPNADAMAWFCGAVLPKLRAAGLDTPVTWVGRASPEEQRRYGQRYGVRVTGYVDDVRPYLHEAACYIVPIRVGGGTRIKILDAWAAGKAVVSTTIGCEGLATADGGNILVRDDPDEFARAVAAVLHDSALREKLGIGGRATVEAHYSWDVIGRDMNATYAQLVAANRTGLSATSLQR
jgi:glycosyltransferase involved in cell wall biosynthesis